MIAQFEPWSFQIKSDFSIRGWRTQWTGKPILCFLHGNGFCGLTYKPLLELLSEDFDLLITDLPGHGESDSSARFPGWNGTAKYCLSVINHFSQQFPPNSTVYGLGHSYGGVITALMAGKDSRRFHKTMLLDPVIFSPGMLRVMKAADIIGFLSNTKLAKTARQRTQHWSSRDEAKDFLQGKGGFKGWREDAFQAYIDYALMEFEQGVKLRCPAKFEAKIYSSYPNNLWRYLKRMKTPCRILMAERSFPFIARSVETLENWPAYSVSSVTGGHCFMQEDPVMASELIKHWFIDDM